MTDENERDEVPREAVEVPIDGTLDLHAFDPREVGDLVPEYLRACRERGIRHVRIVHGKGTGALRRSVLAILARLDDVVDVRPGGDGGGGWGATLVTLRETAGEAPARSDPDADGE